MKNSAVVNHLSLVIAPDRIGNASGFDLSHVAGDKPVDVIKRIRACDSVLCHRRQVEDGRAVPDCEVLELGIVESIRARIPLPLVPLIQPVEFRLA